MLYLYLIKYISLLIKGVSSIANRHIILYIDESFKREAEEKAKKIFYFLKKSYILSKLKNYMVKSFNI